MSLADDDDQQQEDYGNIFSPMDPPSRDQKLSGLHIAVDIHRKHLVI